MKRGHDSRPTLDARHATPRVELGARGMPSDPGPTAGDHITADPVTADPGVCYEGMVVDLSPINSASSNPKVDFLDESGESQFAEWLEEILLRLKAGQDSR